MRQNKAPGPSQADSPPQWMKIAFIGLIVLFLSLGFFILEQRDDANRDLAARERKRMDEQAAVDALRRDKANTIEFLSKMSDDPEFRDREARQRLGVVAPGEIVFRIEPATKTDPAK